MSADTPTRRSRLRPVGVLAVAMLGLGPCGPIPGGALSGRIVEEPVRDWSFVNEVPRCAVEVRPDAPHSVTVNCMAWRGALYVSCSRCEGKRWSSYALADPAGRVRIGDGIYPVTLRRAEDPYQLDVVWQARATKLGKEEAGPRPDGWWTFHLESR